MGKNESIEKIYLEIKTLKNIITLFIFLFNILIFGSMEIHCGLNIEIIYNLALHLYLIILSLILSNLCFYLNAMLTLHMPHKKKLSVQRCLIQKIYFSLP